MRISGRKAVENGTSVIESGLAFYDALEPEYRFDRDEHLQMRSAYEFLRDDLNDAQRAELDKIDTYWKANASEFNSAFATFHFQSNRKTVLNHFVNDDDGDPVEVPSDHWWWHPLEVD